MRAGTIAILTALLLVFPALAGNLAELLQSPTYMGKRIIVVFLPSRDERVSGKLIESGDDYLVLDIPTTPSVPPNPFDKFDTDTIYVIPFSAVLYVQLEKK